MDTTQEISLTGAPGDRNQQCYEHISRVLKRFAYPGLGKGERGVVLAYLRCTTGYSGSPVSRSVTPWEANRLAAVSLAKRYGRSAVPFARKYTAADIELLVKVDRANCGGQVISDTSIGG